VDVLVVGSSNASKMATSLRAKGKTVDILFSPGWTIRCHSAAEQLADQVKKVSTEEDPDLIVMQVMDNSSFYTVNRSRHTVKYSMTHNVTKLPQLKDNKSHVKQILLYMCQICLTIFLTNCVPNTPQVKITEDNCDAYFTQHVPNVTLCWCQIYSDVRQEDGRRQLPNLRPMMGSTTLRESCMSAREKPKQSTSSDHCGHFSTWWGKKNCLWVAPMPRYIVARCCNSFKTVNFL
jgi:hypothetical protein